MPRRRPLLLLPPSKGKSPGGEGPTLDAVLARTDHVLAEPRRRVLDAIRTDVGEASDAEVARLAGVGAAKAAAAREALATVHTAPTLPAHRRYSGVVHSNAGLADVRPGRVGCEVRIVSGLLGLVALDEPVPDYRVEFAATLPSLGGLAPFWRDALADHLAELGRGRRTWDLLPGEHRRVWDPDVRAGLEVVDVAFVRPDGRAANAARTKVAKGNLAAALLAAPSLEPADLPRAVDLGEGWTLEVAGAVVTATSHH